jgi:hypothetical protein
MDNEAPFLYEVTAASLDNGPPQIHRYRIDRETATAYLVTGLAAAGRTTIPKTEIGDHFFLNLYQALTFALNEISRQQVELLRYHSTLARASATYTQELATLNTEEARHYFQTARRAQSLLDDENK